VSSEALLQLGPEIVLTLVAILIYLAGALGPSRVAWRWVALAGLAAAALALALLEPSSTAGPLAVDALAACTRWMALAAGTLLVLLAWDTEAGDQTPEYLGSLLLVVVGVMLVGAAGELVLVFLGLELVSIPTYILLYLGRRDAESREAAAKYFFLSLLASAMLLYGFSFLYGAAGSTGLDAIRAAFSPPSGVPDWLGKIALVFIFAGLSFKITAVPFHFYAPDVYQGTTHANAGLLSVAPKIAGMVALVRIVGVGMEGLASDPWRIALALAVLSMTFGNVVALWQDHLRRLLAYSAIAHAGYMLIGLAVYFGSSGGPSAFDGVGAMLFYLMVYALATLGTFAALNCLLHQGKPLEQIDQLAGLAWSDDGRQRAIAWMIAVFMFSLAGIPPLAGFWGKLALFAGAVSVESAQPGVRVWFVGLAVIGLVNAAIAAAYYLRIVAAMFFRLPLGTPSRASRGGPLAAAVVCALLTVLVGLVPTPCFDWANRASPRQQAVAESPPIMVRFQTTAALGTKTALGTAPPAEAEWSTERVARIAMETTGPTESPHLLATIPMEMPPEPGGPNGSNAKNGR